MARWCFVCDAAVDGPVCATCGREPTLVEDVEVADGRRLRRRRVPRWAVVVFLVGLVAVLLWLEQSGFRLGA